MLLYRLTVSFWFSVEWSCSATGLGLFGVFGVMVVSALCTVSIPSFVPTAPHGQVS